MTRRLLMLAAMFAPLFRDEQAAVALEWAKVLGEATERDREIVASIRVVRSDE